METSAVPDLVWWAIGASAVGVGHLRTATPCQDAFGFRPLPGGGVVIASADGAGSAARSAEGAECAVSAVLDAMECTMRGETSPAGPWEAPLRGAFHEARAAVDRLATAAGDPLRAFATTLTCVLAVESQVAVAQIGDGLVVIEDQAGELTSVPPSRQKRGEYANETDFLTDPHGFDHLVYETHPGDARALVVTTDGLVRLAMELPAYRPFAGFLRPLLGFAGTAADGDAATQRLSAFLASDRVSERTDDDTSLVIAVRRVPPEVADAGTDHQHDAVVSSESTA